jgi:hypothetical protein
METQRETDRIGRKTAISIKFDVVSIEVICGDEYAAQVLYDDLTERCQKGDGFELRIGQQKNR